MTWTVEGAGIAVDEHWAKVVASTAADDVVIAVPTDIVSFIGPAEGVDHG